MRSDDLQVLLSFLRDAEQLKNTLRSAHTSSGRVESVAEHTWRLCLMAMLVADEFPDVDFARLIRMCIIHDLGEVIGGDVPAIDQDPLSPKGTAEREDFKALIASLEGRQRADLLELWDEYEAAATPEARLAKALDKLETILQHNQGKNPADFDYRFNLTYGQKYTTGHPFIETLRGVLDEETRQRAREHKAEPPHAD